MKLDNVYTMFTMLDYIFSNPNCSAPTIRDFLGIEHQSDPSNEEKEFYRMISKLSNEGYINKLRIKKKGAEGAHFALTITSKGSELLNKFKESFSMDLRDKGRFSDIKSRGIVLDSMLRLFSVDSVDVIFDLILQIFGKEFNELSYDQQQKIINMINNAVFKLQGKVKEIAESFLNYFQTGKT